MMIRTIHSTLESWLHRALPWSATNVREEKRSDGFLPDYSYKLKARISEDEFRDYVKSFEMTPHTAERVYEDDAMWLQSSSYDDQGWWDRPRIGEGTSYVYQRGDEWLVAQYKDGWLYMSGANH